MGQVRNTPDPSGSARTVGGMPDEPLPDPEGVEGEIVEPMPADPGYTLDGVPTFDSVREKLDTRYGTALGASELAAETPEGHAVQERYEARQKAADERLAQIRQSMRDQSDSR